MAKDCRAPKAEFGARPCFKCNKPGHLARDCKEPVARQVNAVESSAPRRVLCVTSDEAPLVRGKRIPPAGTPVPSVPTLGDIPTVTRVRQGERKRIEALEKLRLAHACKDGCCGGSGAKYFDNTHMAVDVDVMEDLGNDNMAATRTITTRIATTGITTKQHMSHTDTDSSAVDLRKGTGERTTRNIPTAHTQHTHSDNNDNNNTTTSSTATTTKRLRFADDEVSQGWLDFLQKGVRPAGARPAARPAAHIYSSSSMGREEGQAKLQADEAKCGRTGVEASGIGSEVQETGVIEKSSDNGMFDFDALELECCKIDDTMALKVAHAIAVITASKSQQPTITTTTTNNESPTITNESPTTNDESQRPTITTTTTTTSHNNDDHDAGLCAVQRRPSCNNDNDNDDHHTNGNNDYNNDDDPPATTTRNKQTNERT